MPFNADNPLIVQSDRSILLETNSPKYEAARNALAPFAELVKSPEHIHTYRITPLSLWNAAAAGHSLDEIIRSLGEFSKYDVPENIAHEIREYYGRYGQIKITEDPQKRGLLLTCESEPLMAELKNQPGIKELIDQQLNRTTLLFPFMKRGVVKQALIKIGYPAEDLAGYVDGDPFAFSLSATARDGTPFTIRNYQKDSADFFRLRKQERRLRGHCTPLRSGKNNRGYGMHGQSGRQNAHSYHKYHCGQTVET